MNVFFILLLSLVSTEIYTSTKGPYKDSRYTIFLKSPNHDQKQYILKTLNLIKTIYQKKPVSDKKDTTTTKEPITLEIVLSPEIEDFLHFKSGEATFEPIKQARAMLQTCAYIMQLYIALKEKNEENNFYEYFKMIYSELEPNSSAIPIAIQNKDAFEILAFYISSVYRFIVMPNVTTFFNQTPQLYIKESIAHKIKEQDDITKLQLSEILQKTFLMWNFYAHVFFEQDFNSMVKLPYPDAKLSIQEWQNISLKEAKRLYQLTNLYKTTALEKQQKEIKDFEEYKTKKLAELETVQAQQENEIKDQLEIKRSLLKESTLKQNLDALKNQKNTIEEMQNNVIITEPTLMLVNNFIDSTIESLKMTISPDNIATLEKTFISSITDAILWLQNQSPDPDYFSTSFLLLKNELNQYKIYPQLTLILEKLIYSLNIFTFIRFAGNKQEKLELSIFNKEHIKNNKKTIQEWINFINFAGFSYEGEFNKIKHKKPDDSWLYKFNQKLLWLKNKLQFKTKKLPTPVADQLIQEAQKEKEDIQTAQQEELKKIIEIMKRDKQRIQEASQAAVSKTLAPHVTPKTEGKIIANYDPEYAKALHALFG